MLYLFAREGFETFQELSNCDTRHKVSKCFWNMAPRDLLNAGGHKLSISKKSHIYEAQ